MSRRRLRWAAGAASVALAMQPIVATAAPSVDRVSVEIDTSEVGEEGPVIKRRVRERADVVLRREGFLPAEPDTDDPIVHVDVDPLDGDDPGYAFGIWVMRGDERHGTGKRIECALCTESEVVARIETALLEEIAALRREEPAVVDDAPPPPPPEDPPPEETVPDSDDRSRATHPLGATGRAGIGLMATGLVGSAVGAVLVGLPPTVDVENPLYETTTRPPGVAVLVSGAAVAVLGAVLLVVDRRRGRREQARWRSGTVLRF